MAAAHQGRKASGRGATRATTSTGITRRSRGTLDAHSAAQCIHTLSSAPTPRPPFASRASTQQLPAGLQAGRDHKPGASGVDHDLDSAHEAGNSEHSTHAEGEALKGRWDRHRGDSEGLMSDDLAFWPRDHVWAKRSFVINKSSSTS